MKSLELSKKNPSLSVCAGRVSAKSPLILTRKGKPVAAVVSLKGIDPEALALSGNKQFIRIIERSRKRYREEGGVSPAEARRLLGVLASQRRA